VNPKIYVPLENRVIVTSGQANRSLIGTKPDFTKHGSNKIRTISRPKAKASSNSCVEEEKCSYEAFKTH